MKILLFILASLSISLQSDASQGANSSGGGPGMVCPSVSDPVASAQMLDLFEGGIRYATPTVLSNDSVDVQLARVAAILKAANYALGSNFEMEIAYLHAHSNFLPPGVGMEVPLDVGTDYAPIVQEGCHLEAVGYYDSTGVLEISQTVLSKMDNTDQAAFYTHEALYKMNRIFMFTMNSEQTRQFTASLFSANPIVTPAQIMNFTWNGLQMPDRQFTGNDIALPIYVLPVTPTSVILNIHNPNGVKIDYDIKCLDFENSPTKEWRAGATLVDVETTLDLSGNACQAYSIRINNETAPDNNMAGMSVDLHTDQKILWTGLPQVIMGRTEIFDTLPIYIQE